MVITVRHKFSSSSEFGAVGFGAKPRTGMHSITNSTSRCHSLANHATSNVQTAENSKPSVPATTRIGSSKSFSTTASRLGDPKKAKISASKRSTCSKSMREPCIGQTTGGFNKILDQHPDAKNSPYCTRGAQSASIAVKHRIAKKRKGENRQPTAVERVIVTASKTASKLLDDLEERHRKESSRERITQCLINLRAASERSFSFKEYQSERSLRSEPSLRDVVGDMGVALFNPIDMEVFFPNEPVESLTDDESEGEEEDCWPIEIVVESQAELTSCPRLLTPAMMQQLAEALPAAVRTMTWKRIFALGRDGDAFYTMLHHVQGYQNTIIVVETARGHILGGYAASPWGTQGGATQKFYGSGKSFLFASHPDGIDRTDEDGDELHIFDWTGRNTYCQVCNVQEGQLAMGGGGAFGLIIEENFSKGTTGHCGTFGNPALVPRSGGFFEVAAFEVYGFASMGDTFRGATGV